MALSSWLIVSMDRRQSQCPGPSHTLGSLEPSHQRRHKSWVSLRDLPCAMVFWALLIERCTQLIPTKWSWFAMDFSVSIPHHTRPPIAECKWVWKNHKGWEGSRPSMIPSLCWPMPTGVNYLVQSAKRSGLDPRCHPPSDQKVETL